MSCDTLLRTIGSHISPSYIRTTLLVLLAEVVTLHALQHTVLSQSNVTGVHPLVLKHVQLCMLFIAACCICVRCR